MSEARPPGEPATRLDIKVRHIPPPVADSDSIEIPIEITGTELPAAPPAAGSEPEDMPTAIFRPGMHIAPRPLTGSATRAADAPPARRPAPEPPASVDEWDGETVVKRPAELDPPPARRDPRSFNPEQTVKLDGASVEIELDPYDRTHIAPPRRPR